MSNWFTYDEPGVSQRTFADVDFKRMRGESAVGFYRVHISLYVAMHHSTEPNSRKLAITDVLGDLFLAGTSDQLIGRVSVTDRRNRLIADYSNRTDEFTVEAELDSRRIMAIEEARQGRDLPLRIKLSAYAVDTKTKERFPAEADIRLQATQSDWLRVLDNMQFQRTMLLEVPAPEEHKDAVLAEAASHLASATNHLSRGHYRSTVAACRDALDCVKEKLAESGEAPDNPKLLNKDQRIAKVNEALRNVTHLAHHTDEVSKRTEWRPEDAQAILIMTGALLRMAATSSVELQK